MGSIDGQYFGPPAIEFISGFEDGYGTRVGERGVRRGARPPTTAESSSVGGPFLWSVSDLHGRRLIVEAESFFISARCRRDFEKYLSPVPKGLSGHLSGAPLVPFLMFCLWLFGWALPGAP